MDFMNFYIVLVFMDFWISWILVFMDFNDFMNFNDFIDFNEFMDFNDFMDFVHFIDIMDFSDFMDFMDFWQFWNCGNNGIRGYFLRNFQIRLMSWNSMTILLFLSFVTISMYQKLSWSPCW